MWGWGTSFVQRGGDKAAERISNVWGANFFFVICYNVIYFRLTEALKDGGVEKALKELGLDEGNGSDGNLTDVSPSDYEGEDGGCLQIENDFRDANKSLEAALPGKEWLISIFFFF